MSIQSTFVWICGLLTLGLIVFAGASHAKPAPHLKHLDARFTVGDPATHRGLTLYPVFDPTSDGKTDAAYMTLSAAMQLGLVKVSEVEGGGAVPTLVLNSSASQPVIAAAGDVVLGGNQDRIIAEDMILQPGRSAEVAVNCVEQGRWSEGEMGASFTYGGRSELQLQRVLRGQQDQNATWSAVSALNAAKASNLGAAVTPSTGTYRASLQHHQINSAVQTYMNALLPELSKSEEAVGVVVAYGDEIASYELYDSPASFEKERAFVVRGAALEAVSRGVERGEPPSAAEASRVLAASLGATDVETNQRDAAARIKRQGERTVSYELMDEEGELLRALGYVQ